MKIRKEFYEQVKHQIKKYEFRNSEKLEGIYKVGNKLFELKHIELINNSNYVQLLQTLIFKKYISSKKELEWLVMNASYFYNITNYLVHVYKWIYIMDVGNDYQELEIVE